MNRTYAAKLIFILFLSSMLLCFIYVSVGAVNIPPADIFHVLKGNGKTEYKHILVHVRIPRMAACVLAGSGLALSGAVIQNVMQNPLAGPNIIGVNAGAGLAVVLCSALFPYSYQAIPFTAFIGAFGAMLFIYTLARRRDASRMTLIMAGVCVNSLLNAMADTVHIFWDDTLTSTYGFRLGGFASVNVKVLIPAGILIILVTVTVLLLEKELEVLALGETVAYSVGLNAAFFRFLFLLLAAALAGAAVSIAGLLGFVGLISPHISRRIVGEECRYMLSFCVLFGAFLVMVCDLAARTLWSPYEMPTGILLAFVGAPFFLHLLLRQKRRKKT